MGHSIAVMNTKGGVGKSTVVMALAETLSAYHGKNVLVIDSDSQTSMSSMLMHMASWEQMERQNRTLVDYLSTMVLGSRSASWKDFVASGVSDVEDARSVYLIPSHMELSLFEREVSAQKREADLRAVVRMVLDETMRMFDIVLVDCPPGLSLLTECWLREVQFVIPPTKPDYLAVRGLAILKKFREQYAAQGFAELLGVLINMKDGRISSEEDWHTKLMADPENRCFQSFIPRRAYIQRAADFDMGKRTYIAKYPGDAGQSIRAMTKEVLTRLTERAKDLPARAPIRPVVAQTATATPQRMQAQDPRPTAPAAPASTAREAGLETAAKAAGPQSGGAQGISIAPAAEHPPEAVLAHLRVAAPLRAVPAFSPALSAVGAVLEASARPEPPGPPPSDTKPAK